MLSLLYYGRRVWPFYIFTRILYVSLSRQPLKAILKARVVDAETAYESYASANIY